MMASGKSTKKKRSSSSVVAKSKASSINWITIGAVVAILLLVGGIFTVVAVKAHNNKAAADAAAPYVPSATDPDPSTKIDGIYADTAKYKSAIHVSSTQRVAYDRFPPVGGPHDGTWAACNGVVYPVAMRDENMVHTLEHGSVWITYNPTKVAAGDVDILKGLVQGVDYMVMSPYPTLDQPISLQAWGHQLKVTSASDPRVKQFITALLRNPYNYPEVGATCEQPTFPTTDIPQSLQFDPSPRDSSAVPLDGGTIAPATTEMNGATAAASDPTSAAGSATGSAPTTASVAATSASAPVTSSAPSS
jgi:Protein of unknown function (DUF3105)